MAYKELKGNIFNSDAMAIVNTVNCIGAMGKGIALEYKLRFPDDFMFQLSKEEYQNLKSQIVTSSWGRTEAIKEFSKYVIKKDHKNEH